MNAVARFMFTNRTWGQTIARNVAWVSIGEGMARVLKFGAVLVLVRAVGPQAYGQFAVAFSLAAMLGVVFDAGISTVVTRDLARNPANQSVLRDALGLRLVLTMIGMTVAAVGALIAADGKVMRVLIVALGTYVLVGELSNLLFASFRARQRTEFEAAARLSQGILLAIGVVLIVFMGASIAKAGVVYACSAGVSVLALMILMRVWPTLHPRTWLPMLRSGIPLALAGAATTLYVNMDVVMLGWYGLVADGGWYGAASRLATGVMVLPVTVLSLVLMPALSRLHGDDLRRRVWQWAWLGALAGLGVAVLVVVLAEPAVLLAFGPEYAPTAGALRVLGVATGIMYAYFPWLSVLVATGHQWRLFAVLGSAAGMNLLLNAVLIPPFGMYGAAWATVATHAVIFGALVMAGRWQLSSSRSR